MKYRLLKNDTLKVNEEVFGDHELHRIKALEDFSNVKAGDLGGYVESYENLSQDGDCWIYDNAKAWGHAKVIDKARLYDDVEVYGHSIVGDTASLYDFVSASGDAIICGDAELYDVVCVVDNSVVKGGEIGGTCTIRGRVSKAGD